MYYLMTSFLCADQSDRAHGSVIWLVNFFHSKENESRNAY